MIEDFLSQKSNSGKFHVEFPGRPSFQAYCSIKFVFLEFGSPHVNYVAFLPNYTAEIIYPDDELRAALLFSSKYPEIDSFQLQHESSQVLDIWLQFANRSHQLISEMIKIMDTSNLERAELSPVKFPNSSVIVPAFITMGLNAIEIKADDSTTVSSPITSRTKFFISKYGEPPKFGLELSQTSGVYWIETGSYEAIMEWTLLFEICKENAMLKEKEQFKTPYSNSEPTISTQYDLEALKKQLDGYERQVKRCEKHPLPSMDLAFMSNLAHLSPYEYQLDKPTLPPKRQREYLEKLIHERMSRPKINFERYRLRKPDKNIEIPHYFYDSDHESAFWNQYRDSTENQAFILLCAVVLNGYSGTNLAIDFKIPRIPGQSNISIASRVVKAYKNDIFDVLDGLRPVYTDDSIVHDKDLLQKMKELKKPIEEPLSMPKQLPFQFPHLVVDSFARLLQHILYMHRLKEFDEKASMDAISSKILGFYSHQLIDPDVQAFFKRIAIENSFLSIPLHWSVFKAPKDFNRTWKDFWYQAYVDGKLSDTFLEPLSMRNVIESSYHPSSVVLNREGVLQIVSYLEGFSGLNSTGDEQSDSFMNVGETLMRLWRRK